MSAQDHGQVVDRPQPAPPRRRPLAPATRSASPATTPAPTPTRTSTRAAARSSRKQLGHLTPQLPAYVMIPRMVPGTGLGVPRRGAQAVRDAGRPGQPGPVPRAELRAAAGRHARAASATAAALLQQLRHAAPRRRQHRPARRAGPLPASRRGTSSPRRPPATPSTSTSEPRAVRERYGFMPAFDPEAANRCGCPAWSQRMLLARRLVEAGVRLVTVDLRWWDTHVQGLRVAAAGLPAALGPGVPGAASRTSSSAACWNRRWCVAWGEFGRTPRVNNDAGRDHYPERLQRGAGGRPGQGRPRRRRVGLARAPSRKANPKTPQDVLATLYQHLGVDIDRAVPRQRRPAASRAAERPSRSRSCPNKGEPGA